MTSTDKIATLERQVEKLVELHGARDEAEASGSHAPNGLEEALKKVLWKRIVLPAIGLLLALAGYGGYQFVLVPPDVKPAEVKETVEKRVGDNEQKIEKLGGVVVDQGKQLTESTEYIIQRLDAAHPNTADDVEKPPELKAAEKKAEEHQRDAEVGELLKLDEEEK